MNTGAVTKLPRSRFTSTWTRKNRRPTWFTICGLLALLGNPASASADVTFAAPRSYPVGTSPAAIAVGDFNGDGKIDVAVANTGSGDVSILLGNGDGTFQTATNYSAGNSPTDIAVGDFNGDGKLDLAVFQPGASGVAGTVSILLGNGDGTFQAPKTLAISATAASMVVADFNLDKKSDLAVGDSSNLSIYIGNGDGSFQAAQNTALPAPCIELVTADFNGDSKPDLAVVTASGIPVTTTAGIQILLGRGDGTFTQGASFNKIDVRPPVVAADLNHDGKVDLVVSTVSFVICPTPPCMSQVDITEYLGNGDGSFQSGHIVASLDFFGARVPRLDDPLVGDFNGDGKMDLAYLKLPPGSVVAEFLLGKGDGSFSPPVLDLPLVRVGGIGMIVQDLNADKLSDLISIGTVVTANNIEVRLNTSPTSGADLGLLSTNVSAGPYVVGTNLTFAASVMNQGPQDATGVVLTDTLPSGLTFVSATATPGSCVQTNGIVSCTIGALASTSESSISIVATAAALGTVSNTMSVGGNESDPVSTNNSATQSLTVVPAFTLTVTDAGNGSGNVTSSLGAINCGSTCSGSYAQGTSVSLTVTPAAGSVFTSWSGACTGTDPNSCIIVMNSAQAVTATFNLAPDFSLAAASTSIRLQAGAQTSDALTLTEQNGFSGQVNLTCAVNGTIPLATCGVSPSSVTLDSNPGKSTLTITAPTSLVASSLSRTIGLSGVVFAVVLPVPGILLAGTGLFARREKMRRLRLYLLGSGLIAISAGLVGCGSSTPPPPPKNYTVSVTATSATGSVQHTTNVGLTVN